MEGLLLVLGVVVAIGLGVAIMVKRHDLIRLYNNVLEAEAVVRSQEQSIEQTMHDVADAARESGAYQTEFLEKITDSREKIIGQKETAFVVDPSLPKGFAEKLQQSGGAPRGFAESNPSPDVNTYREAQRILAAMEKDVAAARRSHQACISMFNSEIETVLGKIAANSLGYSAFDFHETPPELATRTKIFKP